MKKTIFALPLAVIALGTLPAHAEEASRKTQTFIEKAAISSQYEIESSKAALEKSTNTEVKALALKMIDDHTKASEGLKAAIASSGLTAPQVPVSLDKKHNDELAELTAKNGRDFDEEYVDDQEDAHEDAVDLFRDYSKDGDNAALKTFAAETLPVLEAHLAHVRTLDKTVD